MGIRAVSYTHLDVYKRQEHEREIVKVREDLNVTINQKLTNVSERDLYRELCADREIELYKLKRNYNE